MPVNGMSMLKTIISTDRAIELLGYVLPMYQVISIIIVIHWIVASPCAVSTEEGSCCRSKGSRGWGVSVDIGIHDGTDMTQIPPRPSFAGPSDRTRTPM